MRAFNYDCIEDWCNHNERLPITAVGNAFEGSFSKINMIKTFNRTSMTYERLAMLGMICIESYNAKLMIGHN